LVKPGKGIRTPGVDDEEIVIHDARAIGADDDIDRSLRPPKLEDFVNQVQVTDQLGIFIEAARRRGEALDHVLLAGPPGLGKTSLANIIAAELDVPMVQTAGPALERKADIAAFLTGLEPGSVFFIDEIHRLGRAVEETLYPAMEDRRLPVVLGQGAGARTVTLDLPPFTLIGATTRTGLLTTPLRDRFGVCHRLEHYEAADLRQIVLRSAGSASRSTRTGPRRSRAEPGAPPESRIASCAACATSPRSRAGGGSTESSLPMRSRCSRSTERASTGTTASCSS
jgi:holliday junction DNA helicase RuvB